MQVVEVFVTIVKSFIEEANNETIANKKKMLPNRLGHFASAEIFDLCNKTRQANAN